MPTEEFLALLRKFELACRDYQSAKDYVSNPPPDGDYGLVIDLTWGFKTPGYHSIKEIVVEQMRRVLPAMITTALEKRKADANATETAVHLYLKEHPGDD